MPAGTSFGPPLGMCIIKSLGLALSAALPTTRVPFAVLRTASVFTAFPPVAFPPLTLAINWRRPWTWWTWWLLSAVL